VTGNQAPGLSAFQIEVARLFYSLRESKGFLLAGGAALLAHRITSRPTRDLDFFTSPSGVSVGEAVAAFEAAAKERSWSIKRVKQSPDFCRLQIAGSEDLIVDFAIDSSPILPVVVTQLGPSYAPEELGARKLLALFERAEARDFTDVYLLARRYGKKRLVRDAKVIDPGFEPTVLAQMFATLRRFRDSELPIDEDRVRPLRAFFAEWERQLSQS
jgi:predicted nucleotidyltransferase component of viral defense system